MAAREIEPAFLERLGRIVTSWAVIEALQGEALSHLLQADPGAMYIMTQNVSAKTVTGWIRTIAPLRLKNPDSQQRIGGLLADLDEARAERNALVHGIWATNCEPGAVLVQTVRWERAEIVRHDLVTLADLDELIDRLLSIRQELHTLVKALENIGSS